MAEKLGGDAALTFERKRMHQILAALEAVVAGDYTQRLPLSPKRDELDAIAHAVNVLVDELRILKGSQSQR